MLNDGEESHIQGEPVRENRQPGPVPEQLAEALRFSLGTLVSISEEIKKVSALREPKQGEPRPANLLNPDYSRPWWPLILGLGGLYLGYHALRKD